MPETPRPAYRTGGLDLTLPFRNILYEIDLAAAFPDEAKAALAKAGLASRPDFGRYILNAACNNLMLTMNYDKNQFPFFMATLFLNRSEYAVMQNHYRDTKFVISIRSKAASTPGETEDARDFFVRNLQCVALDIEAGDPPPLDEEYERTQTTPTLMMNLVLFWEEHVKLNKLVVNRIYRDVTMEEVLGMLSGLHSGTMKPLISIPDNPTRYESVFIPSMSYTQALRHLQNYYGVYRNGLKCFCDFTHQFVMGMDRHIPKDGEHPETVMEVFGPDQNIQSVNEAVYVDDASEVYRIRVPNAMVSVTNRDGFSKELEGSEIRTAFNDEASRSKTSEGQGGAGVSRMTGGPEKRKVYWSRASTDYAFSSRLREINERAETAEVVVDHGLINAFSMDKRMRLLFLNERNLNFRREHRIRSARHAFQKRTMDRDWSVKSVVETVLS